MKNKILDLIKSSATNENDFKSLQSIYALYEQLQYSSNIKQMAEDIFDWLNRDFKVDNMTFALFDINKNTREEIFVKGQEFYLDDDKSHFFIINTHTNLNATISFCATSKVQHKILTDFYDVIDAAFFQISPIIQSGIIKKNYIESSSLDSVTQVYNRNYLIESLTKQLNLGKNNNIEIFFLMIGIDHFKAVIDEFNYDIGDKVLIELAKVIHSNINEFDMVSRLNADEFLVALIDSPSAVKAEEIAKNIIEDFAKIEILVNDETNQRLKKTVCIGIESFNFDNVDETINVAIKNADIALYEAKNNGRSELFKYSELSEEDTIELF